VGADGTAPSVPLLSPAGADESGSRTHDAVVDAVGGSMPVPSASAWSSRRPSAVGDETAAGAGAHEGDAPIGGGGGLTVGVCGGFGVARASGLHCASGPAATAGGTTTGGGVGFG
jgi:hypothetical protein